MVNDSGESDSSNKIERSDRISIVTLNVILIGGFVGILQLTNNPEFNEHSIYIGGLFYILAIIFALITIIPGLMKNVKQVSEDDIFALSICYTIPATVFLIIGIGYPKVRPSEGNQFLLGDIIVVVILIISTIVGVVLGYVRMDSSYKLSRIWSIFPVNILKNRCCIGRIRNIFNITDLRGYYIILLLIAVTPALFGATMILPQRKIVLAILSILSVIVIPVLSSKINKN